MVNEIQAKTISWIFISVLITFVIIYIGVLSYIDSLLFYKSKNSFLFIFNDSQKVIFRDNFQLIMSSAIIFFGLFFILFQKKYENLLPRFIKNMGSKFTYIIYSVIFIYSIIRMSFNL